MYWVDQAINSLKLSFKIAMSLNAFTTAVAMMTGRAMDYLTGIYPSPWHRVQDERALGPLTGYDRI